MAPSRGGNAGNPAFAAERNVHDMEKSSTCGLLNGATQRYTKMTVCLGAGGGRGRTKTTLANEQWKSFVFVFDPRFLSR